MIATLFTLVLAVGFPWVAYRLHEMRGFPHGLSPAVLCYGIGILMGNLAPQWVDGPLAQQLSEGGMIVGLPLLLFGSRLQQSWRLMIGASLWAFALCCLGSLLGTALASWIFSSAQPDGWMPAGMLAGLLTGGSPNLQALGIALDAPSEYVVLIQASDIIGGGVYLMLLMTVIHPFLGLFLPHFKAESAREGADGSLHEAAGLKPMLASLLLSVLTGGVAVGLTILFTGAMKNSTLIILLLTTISLALSLLPVVQRWRHTFRQGEYFVLIFCIALGMQADFRSLMGEGLGMMAFTLTGLGLAIFFQYLLGWLFRIDRDNLMIGSTASIYGPAFIAQVVTSINNKNLLAPGVAMGLLGLAAGNYLGLAVAYASKWLFF